MTLVLDHVLAPHGVREVQEGIDGLDAGKELCVHGISRARKRRRVQFPL